MAAIPETPAICVAAKRGEEAEVEALIAADPSVAYASDPCSGGKTALASAAGGGHVKVVKALLAAGAKDDVVVKGWNAACHAAFRGHAEVLAEIVSKLGAPAVAAPKGVSMPPLLLACAAGHLACASLILDADSAMLSVRDCQERTVLMHAASSGNADLVHELAKRGAPLEDLDAQGKTAFLWAIESHRATTLSALGQLGANPEVRMKPSPGAVQIPGKDITKGDTATDLADSKNSRDPAMRSISKFVADYITQRKEGGEVPTIGPMAHITHAHEFVAAEAAAAAAAANTPAVVPAAAASAAVASNDNDIFGGDDDETQIVEEEPVGGSDDDAMQADFKAAAESARDLARSESHNDLDDLD